MAFKLGNEQRGIKTSAIRKKNVGEGTIARANMDGSIDVDPSVKLNSKFGKRVIKHEQAHLGQMQSGRAAYGDDWVRDGNKTYHRKDGKIKYNGAWHKEGSSVFPWEKRAIKAEKDV